MHNNISVIVPTMNRPDSLRQTIIHIAESTCLPSEVIIIDQSTDEILRDETRSVIKEFEYKLNFYYEFQEIPSLTKARNRGLEIAKEEIIVFSDDDVDVRSSTFASVKAIMQDTSIALIGGFNEGDECKKNSFLGYLFLKSSYAKSNKGHVSQVLYGRFPLSEDIDVDTEWAMGFFFVIRKSLVDKWHMQFDENLKFYAYAEDLDFTYGYYLNAYKEHYKCIMSRRLTVMHNVSTEYRLTQHRVTMMEMIHREYIASKYKSKFSPVALLWCNLGTFCFRFINKNRPWDVVKAIWFILRNRNKIIKGDLLYENYM